MQVYWLSVLYWVEKCTLFIENLFYDAIWRHKFLCYLWKCEKSVWNFCCKKRSVFSYMQCSAFFQAKLNNLLHARLLLSCMFCMFSMFCYTQSLIFYICLWILSWAVLLILLPADCSIFPENHEMSTLSSPPAVMDGFQRSSSFCDY